ncbi:unnamed protein product [Symbiodinium pilosum]|uniref:Uncharacterized protein n=1 Tax=Symbiodinium pilosum TaxID=2952 RepID=A0A812LHV4_SYMPI|nr:unnamed protein product [Symbiodinium pilosum]
MTADVRRMLEVRPRGHIGHGLSNTEGRVLEIMLRENGVRGAFLVIAGFLRMIAHILIDTATLLEIVEYDVPQDATPIREVPADDVLVEVDEGEEESCEAEIDDEETLGDEAAHPEEMVMNDIVDEGGLDGLEDEHPEGGLESENEEFALMQTERPGAPKEAVDAAKSAVAAIKWLYKYHRSSLGGLRDQARRAYSSKLPVLAILGRELVAWLRSLEPTPMWAAGKMTQQLRRTWCVIRNVARRVQKTIQHRPGSNLEDTEMMSLMQTNIKDKFVTRIDEDLAYTGESWWLVMLQKDLGNLKARGVLIGAHVAQLVARMEAMAAALMPNASGPAADRYAMLMAMLQMYANELSDESVDISDEWSETWSRRLQCFLLPRGVASVNEDAVLLADSQVQEADLAEDFAAQEVVALQREFMAVRLEKAKAVHRQREAAKQQAWDDWAFFEEMNRDYRPYTRTRTFQMVDQVRDMATQTGESEAASSSADARRMVPANLEGDDEQTEEDSKANWWTLLGDGIG